MNNSKHRQTLSKAALIGRLNGIIARMDRNRDAYLCSHKKTRDADTGKLPAELLATDFAAAQAELEALHREVNTDMVEGSTLEGQYDKSLVETTIATVLGKVQQQFGHQPNILATLQMFAMLLQSELCLNAHFLFLKTDANVEDRINHPNLYGLDGNPKR
jgi:hypothetical protein